ncbi:MAG TPA: DUF3352 domain-containing protein [Chloroflexota bacterium]|nr:DUF3352 domain-containing protein [Chloroflexota bacterium]
MARRRLFAVLLALSVALVPLRTVAQGQAAAPVALAALFPADTVGYLEIQLRPGDDQGPRLARLLGLLTDLAPDEEQWAWVRLAPRVARALALGAWARGDAVGVVGALAADDPGAVLSFVARASEDAVPDEPYGDVAIVRMGRNGGLYAAAVGSYLLAANDRAALTATVDRVRAGASAGPGLGGATGYRAATGRLPASRFVTGYLDGPGFAGWLASLTPAEGAPPPGAAPAPAAGAPGRQPPPGAAGMLPGGATGLASFGELMARGLANGVPDLPDELDRLRAGSLALSVTAAPEGLRLVVDTPVAWQATQQPASTEGALHFVPPGALAAGAGTNFAAALRPIVEGPSTIHEMLPPGVDWQADLLDWMDGEFGLALLPPSGGEGTAAVLPQVVALFEVRDPPSVEGKLRDLVRAVESAADLPFGEPVEERQGDVVVRRLPLSEDLNITWGYLGRWLFITTGTATTLVQGSAAGGLPASPTYSRLARALPSPNVGVYYADLAGLVSWLGGVMGDRFPLNGEGAERWRDLVGLLGGVAGTTGLPRDGWIESAAVLELHW